MEHLNEEKLEEQIHGNTAIVYHTTRWGDTDSQTVAKLKKVDAKTVPNLVVDALKSIPLITSWVNDKDRNQWFDDIMKGHIADREHKDYGAVAKVIKAPTNTAKPASTTSINMANAPTQKLDYWKGMGRFAYKNGGGTDTQQTNSDHIIQRSLDTIDQKWGFRSGSGDCYGRGFYSVFDVQSLLGGTVSQGNHGTLDGYGGVVLTFYINNLSNYLVTAWDDNNNTKTGVKPVMAQIPRATQSEGVYTQDNFIFKQLVDAGVPWSQIAKFEERCGFKSNPKDAIYNYGVSRFACDFAPYFEGFIYTEGSNDGDVLVTFDIDYILNHESDFADEDKTAFANPKSAFMYANAKLNPEKELAGMSDEERAEAFQDPKFRADYNEKKEAHKKLLTLANNFHNLKSIIPVAYSFDGGKTNYPIRISKEIKQKINLLRNAYSHIEIKKVERHSSPDDILRAYSKGDKFTIPYNALTYGYITKADISAYVQAGHGEIVLNAGESHEYYAKMIDLLHDCKIDHVTIKPSGSGFVNLTDLSSVYDQLANEGIKCILQVVGAGGVTGIRANAASMPLLRAITDSAPVLTSNPTRDCCIYFDTSDDLKDVTPFKTINTWITQVYTPDVMSIKNIDYFKRNFKALKYLYTGGNSDNIGSKQYDGEILDFHRSLIRVKPTIHSFGGIKKNGSVAFVKKLEFNMRKNKQRKAYNNLFDKQGCKDLIDICEGNIKHQAEFDSIVLSPTKDAKFGRTTSCIAASNRIGYDQLSLIGPVERVGSGKIVCGKCAMDLSCFNSLPENAVITYQEFHLFVPEDKKLVITQEIFDKAKGFTNNGQFKIHIPWSVRQNVAIADGISLNDSDKYISHYDRGYTFSKWVDLASGCVKNEKTDDTLEDESEDISDSNDQGDNE